MKNTALLVSFLFIHYFTSLHAQEVFSYGNHQVNKEEFLKAFLKNNNQQQFSEKDFRDYLDLYIRFKLKVQAAYDQKLDTLPSQKSELNDFRNQVMEEFLHDQQSLDKLVKEAFDRSQKDIHLAHIFIPLTATGNDTAQAQKRAMEAYDKLKKGENFKNIASGYSADPSVKTNQGDIGWITVFTLPYQLENIIYNTPAGKFSQPYRSRAGYHIFKNLGERKAAGKVKAAQILFSFFPDATAEMKKNTQRKADSVYNLLLKGAPFPDMVSKYSNDRTTAATNGEMQEFGLGNYDAAFDSAVFALTREGSFTRPVLTDYGFHIVRLLERIPVNTDINNQEALVLLKQQVQTDARMEVSRVAARKNMFTVAGYKKAAVNEKDLWSYTDSALRGKTFPGITDRTLLFSFNQENMYAGDWIRYLQANGGMGALSASRTYSNLMNQFTDAGVEQYYKNRLEAYNPAFAAQMKEFREGNLLFEIMQRTVWQKAAADSAALISYYERNKNKYWWDTSAEAVLFTCRDTATAAEVRGKLEKNKIDWRRIIEPYNESVQADSGRFELAQLPVQNYNSLTINSLSQPVRSSLENNSVLFVYIIRKYTGKSPRNFNDSKGFVLNDYQSYLEDKWIESLKKSYPVKVNEAVFRTLWK